jgi:hypothetical protein
VTVNERLYAAKLLDIYTEVEASGNLDDINAVLIKVDLKQDESGMNWDISDAQNAR